MLLAGGGGALLLLVVLLLAVRGGRKGGGEGDKRAGPKSTRYKTAGADGLVEEGRYGEAAGKAMQAHNFDEAVSLYRLADQPAAAAAAARRGGKLKQAAELYEMAGDKREAAACWEKAGVYERADQLRAELDEQTDSLVAKPAGGETKSKHPPPGHDIADEPAKDEPANEAEAAFRKAQARAKNDPAAAIEAQELAREAADRLLAVGEMRRAAEVFRDAGLCDEAIHLFVNVLGSPGEAAPLMAARGNHARAAELYEMAGQLERAANAWVTVARESDSPESYIDRIESLDDDVAFQFLDAETRARALTADTVELHYRLAVSCEQRGDRERATKVFEVIVRTVGDYKDAKERMRAHPAASPTAQTVPSPGGAAMPSPGGGGHAAVPEHAGGQVAAPTALGNAPTMVSPGAHQTAGGAHPAAAPRQRLGRSGGAPRPEGLSPVSTDIGLGANELQDVLGEALARAGAEAVLGGHELGGNGRRAAVAANHPDTGMAGPVEDEGDEAPRSRRRGSSYSFVAERRSRPGRRASVAPPVAGVTAVIGAEEVQALVMQVSRAAAAHLRYVELAKQVSAAPRIVQDRSTRRSKWWAGHAPSVVSAGIEREAVQLTLLSDRSVAASHGGPAVETLIEYIRGESCDLGNIEVYYRLGMAYLGRGQWSEALDAFREVEEVSPGYRDAEKRALEIQAWERALGARRTALGDLERPSGKREEQGRYTIAGELGRGGMAVVYRAHDRLLGRDVALKFMAEEVSERDDLREMFHREARAAASLNHPSIVTIFDFGMLAERAYICMELVDGAPVDELQEDLTIVESLQIGKQTLDALAYAHERHIIHRDIKPGNIMRTKAGTVKLMDFGLARPVDSRRADSMIIGTPAFMPPEQLAGIELDHRADIFAMGVTLYTLLGRELPFEGVDRSKQPRSLQELVPAIPKVVDDAIRRSLALVPEHRFASAKEFAEPLQEVLDAVGQFSKRGSRK